jgi:hypothetical protein
MKVFSLYPRRFISNSERKQIITALKTTNNFILIELLNLIERGDIN